MGRQRSIAEAFLAASRSGDIEALIAVLDPDVVRRADRNALPPDAPLEVQGMYKVVTETATNAALAQHARTALVNGAVGLIVVLRRKLRVAIRLKIDREKITEIDVITDPVRIRQAEIAV